MTSRTTRAARTVRSGVRARKRSRAQPLSLRARLKTLLALCVLAIETLVAALLLVGLIIFYRFSHDIPDVAQLVASIKTAEATTIWSQDGVLLGRLQLENRLPITLAEMTPDVVHATVAVEDHRFYHHFGVDPSSILRAAVADVRGEDMTRQGASTLTQQLVRNVPVFGLSREKKYSRKVREALIAIRMEQVFSKNEILSLYLNNVYYGAGAYGIEAAARTYFGKHASQLTLAEAALLAGLPQRPGAYTPFTHRRAALARRDEVLAAMVRYGYTTESAAHEAQDQPLHFVRPRRRKGYAFKAPYFVWYIINQLVHRYGADYVYSGVRVETTLNWKMQQAAEKALTGGLAASSGSGCNQGCLVALDNRTGYIRAMVGGRDFRASQFNNVTQGERQPGSTFKLFDYAAAFDTGKCTIDDGFRDVPVPYPHSQGKVVHDFEPWTYRTLTCRDAIAHSVNTIAVQVAALAGIRTVIAYAHRMGISSPLAPYLPTAIGASAVRPIDLCEAYSLVADGGTKHSPMGILRVVEPDGTIDEQDQPQEETDILQRHTIDELNDAFEAVVTYGTGTAAKGDTASGVISDARGKTGTTSDFRDAWFAGYTPELTTVVWVASVHHTRRGVVLYEPMERATGGVVCAPIWHNFMIQAIPVERKFLQAQQPAVLPGPSTSQASPRPAASANHRPVSAPPPQQRTLTQPPSSTGPLLSGQPANAQPAAMGSTPANNDATLPPAQPSTTPGPPPAAAQPAPPQPMPPPSKLFAAPASTPRPMAPKVQRQAAEKMVTVTLCVDSRELATEWCPATIQVSMPASQARKLHRCRIHHPPPGAG